MHLLMYNTPLKTSVTSPALYTALRSFLLLPQYLLYTSHRRRGISCHCMLLTSIFHSFSPSVSPRV